MIASVSMKAQQLPHYSNYMLNQYAMNPAVGGSSPYFEGISNNRYQWIGITDAPRTYMLTVQGPTKNLKMGVGGSLFTDIVGPTRRTGFYLSYAYHLKVAEKVRVSLGISAGLLQFMVDGSKITLHDPKDNVISGGVEQVITPDFGAGIYVYSTDKKWYVGASVPQIMQSQIKFKDYTYTGLSRLATHYYVTAGYKFDIGDDFKIEPSGCLKYVEPAPLQFDLGLRGIYKEKIWIGGAFRYLDAVSAMVGFTLQENLTVAYAYDFTMTNIGKYSTGTHELMLGIKFHKTPEGKSREKIK
ncbi:MAG: Bacteroidetes-specific putative rane protein [Bacteroidota bacterium]|jgi:type IX secretion system PorP/SprF family membrane protein|nr:Bacteroidetes-specific putative rane protein [Bacteroidota bacterium]